MLKVEAYLLRGMEIQRGDTIIAKDGHRGVVETICMDDVEDCATASVGFADGHTVKYRTSEIAVLLDRPGFTPDHEAADRVFVADFLRIHTDP